MKKNTKIQEYKKNKNTKYTKNAKIVFLYFL